MPRERPREIAAAAAGRGSARPAARTIARRRARRGERPRCCGTATSPTSSPDEKALLDAMLAELDSGCRAGGPPARPSGRGELDVRRTLRDDAAPRRRAGPGSSTGARGPPAAPGGAAGRRLRLDAPYADALLRFAHAAVGADARQGPVEVFTLGTRLTRVTPALRTARRGAGAGRARASRSRTGRAAPGSARRCRRSSTAGARGDGARRGGRCVPTAGSAATPGARRADGPAAADWPTGWCG